MSVVVTVSASACALDSFPATASCYVSMWVPACSPTVADVVRVGLLIGTALLVVLAGRVLWLGIGSARRVRALPRMPIPFALARSAAASGISVCVLTSPGRIAFCAGLARPQVYLSVGAVRNLAADELEAVLIHEAAHARHRDPLRGLVRRAVADVVFFAPLLRRWDEQRCLRAELAADRAAVCRVGAPALAGALLGMIDGRPAEVPAFGPGSSDLDARIAALAATTPPARRSPIRAGTLSTVGVLMLTTALWCLTPLLTAGGGQGAGSSRSVPLDTRTDSCCLAPLLMSRHCLTLESTTRQPSLYCSAQADQ